MIKLKIPRNKIVVGNSEQLGSPELTPQIEVPPVRHDILHSPTHSTPSRPGMSAIIQTTADVQAWQKTQDGRYSIDALSRQCNCQVSLEKLEAGPWKADSSRISETFSVAKEEVGQSPQFLEALVLLSGKHHDIDVAAQRFSLMHGRGIHLSGRSPEFEDEYFASVAMETLRYGDRTMREFKHLCAPQQSTKRARQDESGEGDASSSKRTKISEEGLASLGNGPDHLSPARRASAPPNRMTTPPITAGQMEEPRMLSPKRGGSVPSIRRPTTPKARRPSRKIDTPLRQVLEAEKQSSFSLRSATKCASLASNAQTQAEGGLQWHSFGHKSTKGLWAWEPKKDPESQPKRRRRSKQAPTPRQELTPPRSIDVPIEEVTGGRQKDPPATPVKLDMYLDAFNVPTDLSVCAVAIPKTPKNLNDYTQSTEQATPSHTACEPERAQVPTQSTEEAIRETDSTRTTQVSAPHRRDSTGCSPSEDCLSPCSQSQIEKVDLGALLGNRLKQCQGVVNVYPYESTAASLMTTIVAETPIALGTKPTVWDIIVEHAQEMCEVLLSKDGISTDSEAHHEVMNRPYLLSDETFERLKKHVAPAFMVPGFKVHSLDPIALITDLAKKIIREQKASLQRKSKILAELHQLSELTLQPVVHQLKQERSEVENRLEQQRQEVKKLQTILTQLATMTSVKKESLDGFKKDLVTQEESLQHGERYLEAVQYYTRLFSRGFMALTDCFIGILEEQLQDLGTDSTGRYIAQFHQSIEKSA